MSDTQAPKKQNTKIATKIILLAVYACLAFIVFGGIVMFLYYKNMNSQLYSQATSASAQITNHFSYLASQSENFYKHPSFKRYIASLNRSSANEIYLANDSGIIVSSNNNGSNVLYKSFLGDIDKTSSLGKLEYSHEGTNYLLNYQLIRDTNIWVYHITNKDQAMATLLVNLKKLFILLVLLSLSIVVTALVVSINVKKSIRHLYNNVKVFIRSRNIAQIQIHENDEFSQIYNLFHEYSDRVLQAHIQDDKAMITSMENMIDNLKQGSITKIDYSGQKEVLVKVRTILNSVIDIFNSHLTSILKVSNQYLENDFSVEKKEMLQGDLMKVYSSINKLGVKFNTITLDNIEVSTSLEDNQYRITSYIEKFKENFENQLLCIDEAIESVTDIYINMGYTLDLSNDIIEATDDITRVANEYQNFGNESLNYISQVNDYYGNIEIQLEDIEYYSLKANILSMNTAIKNQSANDIGFFSVEFREITSKINKCTQAIKDLILENTQKAKDFYLNYDQINHSLLVKRVNQISSFAKKIDESTKQQFQKLSVLQNGIDGLFNKNKLALLQTNSMTQQVQNSEKLTTKLLHFLQD